MKKRLMIMAGVLFLVILTACSEDEETNDAESERVVPVEVEEVTEGDLIVERSIFGRTSPNTMTPVMIQNPGEIDTLEVSEGDVVEEDDLIATILTQVGTQNIYAPASGEIVSLDVEEGAMASNSDPIAIVAEVETMKLQFNVTSSMLSHIENEDTFTAVINNQNYDAEVTRVAKMPNDTGLYEVEATVENEDGDLLVGVVAQMNVPVSRVENTIIVPTAALIDESDETIVYVINNDEVVRTEITATEVQTNQAAIEGELSEGDQVVVTGQLLLSDGTKVNILEESEE